MSVSLNLLEEKQEEGSYGGNYNPDLEVIVGYYREDLREDKKADNPGLGRLVEPVEKKERGEDIARDDEKEEEEMGQEEGEMKEGEDISGEVKEEEIEGDTGLEKKRMGKKEDLGEVSLAAPGLGPIICHLRCHRPRHLHLSSTGEMVRGGVG